MLEALGEPVPELAQEPAPVKRVLKEPETGFGAEELDYGLCYLLEA